MGKHTNLVFGGAGLVGRALVSELQKRGEETVVYDLQDGFDLRFTVPASIPAGAYCWFLAWDVGGVKYITDESQQVRILRSNLALCDRVFSWLQASAIPYTFIGTQMAGYPNAYGLTKQIGEYWCSQIGNGLIARLWNVYDAEEVSIRSHLVPDLVKQGVGKGRINLMTSGGEKRQFLYAADCAKALIVQREVGQSVADITSGEWIPVSLVAETVACQLNCELVLGDEPGYESLVDPVNHLPNWRPEVDLEEGIARCIEKMKANGWA